MTKTKIILLVCFGLIFGAGISVGRLSVRPEPARATGGMLERELNLSQSQKEQMKAIWADAMGSQRQQRDQRRAALSQERDQKIAALLSDAQRTQYDAIRAEFSRKMDELGQERRQAFEKAVEQTKKILTPEQAKKYEEMRRPHDRDGGGQGEAFGGRHSRSTSTSRPATRDTSTSHSEE